MDIIQILNKLGFRILEIENLNNTLDYFSISQFNESTTTEHKHTVRGKLITKLVNSNLHINILDVSHNEKITNELISLQDITKYYHKDCKFILHI